MVPYEEPWMDRVDMMKQMQGWTDVTVTHFRDMAVLASRSCCRSATGTGTSVNNPAGRQLGPHWRPKSSATPTPTERHRRRPDGRAGRRASGAGPFPPAVGLPAPTGVRAAAHAAPGRTGLTDVCRDARLHLGSVSRPAAPHPCAQAVEPLTAGVPSALREPAESVGTARRLAALIGCESAVLGELHAAPVLGPSGAARRAVGRTRRARDV